MRLWWIEAIEQVFYFFYFFFIYTTHTSHTHTQSHVVDYIHGNNKNILSISDQYICLHVSSFIVITLFLHMNDKGGSVSKFITSEMLALCISSTHLLGIAAFSPL